MDFHQRLNQLRNTFEKLNQSTENAAQLDPNTEELYSEMKQLNKAYTYLLADYKQYFSIKKEHQTYFTHLKQFAKLQSLNTKQIDRIRELVEQHKTVMIQRDELQEEIRNKDKNANRIGKHVEEIQGKLKEITEMSQNEKLIHKRIRELQGIIEGSQSEREYLKDRQKNIYHISITAILFFSFASFVLVLLASVYNMNILTFGTVLAAIAILGGAILYIARRNTIYELKKLSVEEQKSRKLLSKEKIKLFNAANYLQYQYKKYKVKDAETLEKDYISYKEYTRQIEKYKNTSRRIAGIESLILSIVEEVGIESLDFVQGRLEGLFNLELQQELYERLLRKSNLLEDRIAKMEEDRIALEKFLDDNLRRHAKNPILRKMIEQYERELKEIESDLDKDYGFI